jgi:hypothetical protein
MADLNRRFTEMLTNISGPQISRRGFPNDPMMTGMFPFGGSRFPGGFGGTLYPQDPRNLPQAGNMTEFVE